MPSAARNLVDGAPRRAGTPVAPRTLRSVALLVFLARAAGAGIVASDFLGSAHHLLHGFLLAASGHARLLEFATLPSLEGFFELVDGGRNLPRWPSISSARTQHGHTRIR